MRSDGIQAVVVWARRIVIVAVVVIAALIVRRYDFERLPRDCHDLDGVVRPEALLVLSAVNEDAVIGVGSLVEAEGSFVHDGEERSGTFLSQVRGEPGDVVSFRKVRKGKVEILVNGEHTWAFMPEGDVIPEGPIPGDCYLLLDPASDHGGVDSRLVGLVPRARLRRKIISHL